MLTFSQCESLIGKRDSKKLENNTYLERINPDCYGVRLHSTYVVRVYRDGRYVIDSGGWLTVTTKDRINKYSPCRVHQSKHVWYINGPGLDEDTPATFPLTVRPH